MRNSFTGEKQRFALLTSWWLSVELCLIVACHQIALGWWIHFQGELHWNILTVTSPHLANSSVQLEAHLFNISFHSIICANRLTYDYRTLQRRRVITFSPSLFCQKSRGEKSMRRCRVSTKSFISVWKPYLGHCRFNSHWTDKNT